MKSLIIKVFSICIVIVIATYLIVYAQNAMITKAVSVCIVAIMVIYWIIYARNTRKRKIQELQRDDYLYAKDSGLPLSVN